VPPARGAPASPSCSSLPPVLFFFSLPCLPPVSSSFPLPLSCPPALRPAPFLPSPPWLGSLGLAGALLLVSSLGSAGLDGWRALLARPGRGVLWALLARLEPAAWLGFEARGFCPSLPARCLASLLSAGDLPGGWKFQCSTTPADSPQRRRLPSRQRRRRALRQELTLTLRRVSPLGRGMWLLFCEPIPPANEVGVSQWTLLDDAAFCRTSLELLVLMCRLVSPREEMGFSPMSG